jgi:hypothetical protein
MFQEYTRRKELSTSKETIFEIEVGRDEGDRILKYKTIRDVERYMGRKQVTKDDLLSSRLNSAGFPHTRSVTPPISSSSAIASPSSHKDSYKADAPPSASLTGFRDPNTRTGTAPDLQRPTTYMSRSYVLGFDSQMGQNSGSVGYLLV